MVWGCGKRCVSLETFAAGTVIGDNVTVGHSASLAGVTLEDQCLIGMGATLHNGVKVPTYLTWLSRTSLSIGTLIDDTGSKQVLCITYATIELKHSFCMGRR